MKCREEGKEGDTRHKPVKKKHKEVQKDQTGSDHNRQAFMLGKEFSRAVNPSI